MDKLGLFKYADELRSARDRVLQGSSDSGWAVFAYEGQTNVLKLAEAGEDLEEGFQALDANRIMYMYARVIDPNSQLAKYVLINWCGTGAPEMRKAVCATHVPEVCRFLTKIHVTMNVRSEDELSVENLQLRVAKASGANYNAGAAVQNVKPSTAPRPSNATGYVRPNAAAEIQASNREKFWEGHDKDDEAARKNDEAKRKAETQARFAPVKAAKLPVFAASASTANSNGGASQATSAKPAAALLSERDRFWAEQEAEEQRRREEEKRRIEEEQQRREAETRERELKAAVKREAEAKARAEQIVTRKQYTAAAEASAPRTQTPASTATDAASDENERGKRPDAAKHARQQEIQALIKARNAQGDAPDSSLSKRADDLRSQRQEEIRKMMAQRGGVDDEEEERRRRAEELRKQREREMQEAFAKRSDTADTEEDERRRRADELRRNRQEEMRQTIGASGSAQPSVIATRNPPVVQPQSAPPFRPNPPVIPSPVVAAPEPVVHTEAPARPYIPPMAKQVLPGPRTALPVESQYQPTPAPAPAPALAPAPAPVAPVSIGVNPLAAAAAAIATNYTAQSGANINDSPNNASQKYFYKAGSSGQPSPSGSPTKDSRSSTYGNNEPAPYYADPEQTNDESEPQDVYQNVPYVSNNANSTGRAAAAPAAPAQEPPQDNNFYVNEQVSRGQRASMNRVSDLYEPVSFGATQSAKRSSYRNANDDDELDAPRSNTTSNSNTVRALYDYEAQDSDEISFSVDELITEVQQIDSGWWLGTNQSGKTGMFPANYVATFSDS